MLKARDRGIAGLYCGTVCVTVAYSVLVICAFSHGIVLTVVVS